MSLVNGGCKLYELLDFAIKLYNSPNRKLYIKFANQTRLFLKENIIEKTIKKISTAELSATCNIAIFINEEKNPYYAIQRILVHLESTYYIYLDYYNNISYGLFSNNKKTNTENLIKQICILIAIYHKVLQNNPAVIKQWLIDSVFPCNDFTIIEFLLGTEFALEYKKELDELAANIPDNSDDPFYYDPFL